MEPEPTRLRRILMTVDAVGGVWNYAVELARGLREHEVEVLLAVMGSSPSTVQRAQLAALEHVTLAERPFPLEWMTDPWVGVGRAAAWLRELEARHVPDVLHFNAHVHAAFPWKTPTVVVAHSCVCSWQEAVRGRVTGVDQRYRLLVRRGLRGAGAVVAPTRAMHDSLHRQYGPLRPVLVIAHGRREWAFDATRPKEPFFLTAGRLWDDAKNLATLVRAAGGLPWPVLAAGPANDAAPGGDVHLLGPCDTAAMAALYARAAVYVAPARYEPFGLAILEAALSGCALILGDIPSLRELWHDAAEFVAPSDAAALRRTMLALAGDPSRRAELGRRARRRGQAYSAGRMVDAYAAVYRRLLESRIVPAPAAVPCS